MFQVKSEDIDIDWDRKFRTWVASKNLTLSFFDDDFAYRFFSLLSSSVTVPRKNALHYKVMIEFAKMEASLE